MTGKIQQCLAAAGRILYAFTERPSELWSSVRLLCGKYFLSNINIHKDILAYVYKNFHAVPSFPPRKTPPQEPKPTDSIANGYAKASAPAQNPWLRIRMLASCPRVTALRGASTVSETPFSTPFATTQSIASHASM